MRFNETEASCEVFVEREGVLRRVGHDIKLRVSRLWIDVTNERVEASFDARSVVVACALDGSREDERALSPKDKETIAENTTRDVLDANGHPNITFVSTHVERDVSVGVLRVRGTLTLRNRAREIALVGERRDDRFVVSYVLDQTQFGIAPFTAMLGALRVKPTVRVVTSFPART